jgi:U3 small nucleolar RNA-associated protein 24
MGKSTLRKTKQVREKVRRLKPNDNRLKTHATSEAKHKKVMTDARDPKKDKYKLAAQRVEKEAVNRVSKTSTALFLSYNTQLGPPYRILIDTNFINFSIQNKLDIFTSLMDCLLAKCIPIITDCVMAELEKLGIQYRVALRLAKDERFERYPCTHKGVYADDCIIDRITNHKCFIVATCDRELKRRIRKIAGVPIMFISDRKYMIERFADVSSTPA